MSALGSLYIKLGEPEGELMGCCETADWAAQYIGELRAENENAWSDAHRLALELECLLLSTDNPAATKWWDSANEALELHRKALKETL